MQFRDACGRVYEGLGAVQPNQGIGWIQLSNGEWRQVSLGQQPARPTEQPWSTSSGIGFGVFLAVVLAIGISGIVVGSGQPGPHQRRRMMGPGDSGR